MRRQRFPKGGRGRTDPRKPALAQKKHDGGWACSNRGKRLRREGTPHEVIRLCEKLEIIQLVEHSHLPVRRTLVKLGIPRATFYRWYDLYRTGGPDRLGRSLAPAGSRAGTRFLTWCASGSSGSCARRAGALPRELAVRFTDTERYFVSEASVYRLLTARPSS